jgi:hypothetical protein
LTASRLVAKWADGNQTSDSPSKVSEIVRLFEERRVDLGSMTLNWPDELTAAGASVSRASHALPDLAQTAATYTKLFMSLAASFWPLEF